MIRPIWCPACNFPTLIQNVDSGREGQHCIRCKSNARQRSLVLGAKIARRQVRARKAAARALGISDGPQTARWATEYFGDRYTNTFFHQAPRLDLTNIPTAMYEMFNIVICSEVLEHVEPPVSRGFFGLSQLLETNGLLVLSVPYNSGASGHVEHFPELSRGQLVEMDGHLVWRGLNSKGDEETHTNLRFHGGVGSTLEFRVFSEHSLQEHLNDAGFVVVKKLAGSHLSGTHWEPWSRVWLAQKVRDAMTGK